MTAVSDGSDSRIKTRPKAVYWTPGSFFSEDVAVELPERSVKAAVDNAPRNAFAFKLYDSPICTFDFRADLFRVTPIPQNYSARHYIGGTVYSVAELAILAQQDPDQFRILHGNADCNGWPGAIKCRTGNWQPFEDGDVLIEVPDA